jgi:hypothetical protein
MLLVSNGHFFYNGLLAMYFFVLLIILAAATFACRPCELHSIQGALSIHIAFRIETQMQLSYIFFGGGEMEGRDYFKSLL